MQVQLLGGQKIIQNLAQFRTTFDFSLWNGWRYRHMVNGVINYSPSRIEPKYFPNFGPPIKKL